METKKIVLERMEIHKFKGIQTLEMDFKPGENSLYGANAAGKTTVYDALLWLLFDKDSAGNSKFTIKPIGSTKGVTPTVTAYFLVNGQSLKLQSPSSRKKKSFFLCNPLCRKRRRNLPVLTTARRSRRQKMKSAV